MCRWQNSDICSEPSLCLSVLKSCRKFSGVWLTGSSSSDNAFSRILNLVAHYEAGLDYNLDVLIRSTYKFLIKMEDLYEVQKEFIKFLRGLGDIYPHEVKGEFIKLLNKLKEFENDPYQSRAFLYLDIISWLESKIENKPIGQVIRRKFNEDSMKK